MGVGRFLCVAFPFIFSVASLAFLLAACLAGVANKDLYIFRINSTELSINPVDIKDALIGSGWRDALPDDFDFDSIKDVDLSDLSPDEVNEFISSNAENLKDNAENLVGNAEDLVDNIRNSKRDDAPSIIDSNLTAKDLGIDNTYYISLWGFCTVDAKGDRKCNDPEFNWAHKQLDTKYIKTDISGSAIQLPKELDDALDVFKEVTRWTQIAYIIAFVLLALSVICGIFANCTRIMSCVTWVIANLAWIVVVASASLSTSLALVVVGAVEASAEVYGVRGGINVTFLTLVWISSACAMVAGFFWLFTICCCAPDRTSRKRRGSKDYNDKYFPPTNNSSSYQPLPSPDTQGFYNQQQTANQYGAPRYPEGARSDMAYEPYSHRV